MLTALDLLNRFLGYFNIQDKAKGKAFTVVAGVANFYVLYLAIRSLRYAGYRIQGVLFLLLFFVLLYFIALNVLYYFTTKTTKLDISPLIEKRLGGNPERMKAAEAALTKGHQIGAASGVFAQQELLPTVLTTTPKQQENLANLIQLLTTAGTITTNYQGLDAHAIQRVAQKTHKPVSAMGGPVELPYYRLDIQGDQVQVLGGLNALNAVSLGDVTQVGLMPVKAALKDYQLAAGHVFLQGGEHQRPGRHGLLKENHPYEIVVQIAYSPLPDVTGQQN